LNIDLNKIINNLFKTKQNIFKLHKIKKREKKNDLNSTKSHHALWIRNYFKLMKMIIKRDRAVHQRIKLRKKDLKIHGYQLVFWMFLFELLVQEIIK